MTIQPDVLQSASKRRQFSGGAAPRVPTKKRKIFTRRVIKKTAQPSPSPSDSNTNQVIHLSKFSWMFSPFICTYTLVDCNPFSRTQLKTTLAPEAHHNREPLFMNSIPEQLKSLNSKKQPSSKQKFIAKKPQQMMWRWKPNPELLKLRVTNKPTQPMPLLLPQLSRSHSDRLLLLPYNK